MFRQRYVLGLDVDKKPGASGVDGVADMWLALFRTSLQKPGDELLADFRLQFPEVSTTTSASAAGPSKTATAGEILPIAVSSQER